MSVERRTADVIVIGSGVAGLSAALAALPARVILLTKTHFGGGNSILAQGGVAVALGDDDSPQLHLGDTLAVGGGINDEDAVRVLTSEGPGRARLLLELGTRFDRRPDGNLDFAREAAHSVRRVLHAADATGAAVVDSLRRAVRDNPRVQVVEHHAVFELHRDGGRVCAVSASNRAGHVTTFHAGSVVLATGGSGRLFDHTTNPVEATADGLCLAARAGATLRDLEFVQFHPTALAARGADPLPLLTEALRGDGAVLVDEHRRRIAGDWHPDGDLAPRDVVARGIARHRLDGHEVYLDVRPLGDRFLTRFPNAVATCGSHDVDLRLGLLPVSPAAHYHMGGVATSLHGRTDVAGLLAAGEVAATGAHGANRLASNSLLEALVFGARAGAAAAADSIVARSTPELIPSTRLVDIQRSHVVTAAVRRTMWQHVGLLRTESGVTEAIDHLESLPRAGLDHEARNLLLAARLVAAAALTRTESRGAHHRLDHPDVDDAWTCHSDVHLVDDRVVITRSDGAQRTGAER